MPVERTNRSQSSSSPGDATPRPNFIVIGPGKCGTTWIHEVLRDHPGVGMASAKETLYFEDQYRRGERWYLRHFQGLDPDQCRAIGEVSNTYVFSPEAAERIRRFDRSMKIVSCLRNPIDRTFSHYLFLRRNGERRSFEHVLRNTDIAERGLYYRHLRPYFERFPREQVLVLFYEWMREHPAEFSRTMFRFLDVEEGFKPAVLNRKTLPASAPRSRAAARLAKAAAVGVRSLGRPDWVTRVKRSPVTRLLYRPFRSSERPELTPPQRRELATYFRPDVEALTKLLGIDVSYYWPDFRDG